MSYYKTPVYGRAFRPFSTQMVEVSSTTISQWTFKKLVNWKKRGYALFTNNEGEEIMQSLQAIRFVRCKPGEDNISSKITNAQGIDVFNRANAGESRSDLAKEFNISERYVSDIKNIRARVGITLDYLNNVPKNTPAKVAVATRNKGKKLSLSLANFMRADNTIHKLDKKLLSAKYHVSIRTVERILNNEMYKVKP